MKLLIITTDTTTLQWKSLQSKLDAIKKALNKTKNTSWDIEIKYQDITPEIINGRITHEWFNTFAHPLFRQGYHHVYLHFSMARWEELGFDQSIRGANQVDSDYVGECYGRGDERTYRGKTRQNQFIQNVLHEMSHELSRATGVVDRTHAYHAKNTDISGIFATYDINKWQPRYVEELRGKISIMQKIISLLKQSEETLFHPIQWKPRIISQNYGVISSRYPRTKRHIGTDYAIPVNTPVYAPFAGKVTTSGVGKATGNFCHFEYTYKGVTYEERWCHLNYIPRIGTYSRGSLVSYSGNTGDSDGPHLHREVWLNGVRIDLINEKNWNQMTIDPESLI